MPYDIIYLFFKAADLHDATLLGVTCPKLYAHLKTYHKKPIPLSAQSSNCCQLGGREYQDYCRHCLCFTLSHWKGLASYDLIPNPPFIFFRPEPYGWDSKTVRGSLRIEQLWWMVYQKERQLKEIAGYKDGFYAENSAAMEVVPETRIARKLLEFAGLNPGGFGDQD